MDDSSRQFDAGNELPSVTGTGTGNVSQFDGPLPEISNYQIRQMLGHGGMGVVYLAYQDEPIRRRVAIKVIKPGMDSQQVLTRFEAERQTLAMLTHANIAHVYAAGSTDRGYPYFVMEYIQGMRITEFCDSHKLSIEQRLELFVQVCEAIEYAHQKGIIHRDIKPSNILVSVVGKKVIPKIIDFGISKAVNLPLTQQTILTEKGQLIGTPEYMSPEQADVSDPIVDTRTDIYSLGVLLYELLTGTLPFDSKALREAAFHKIVRIIREEEPPRPSTRLSGVSIDAQKVAENRCTEVRALSRRLHKELEWIPLKALRKEPDRRYKTASQLAADVQNYLDGHPLVAGPESAAYRIKKFIRKHSTLVGAIAAVIIVLAMGMIASTIFAMRAFDAEKAEKKQRLIVEKSLADVQEAEGDARNQAVAAEEARANAEVQREVALQAQQLAEERLEELRFASYVDKIHLADNLLGKGDLAGAFLALIRCPEDLRHWEWFHLWQQYQYSGRTFYPSQLHNVISAAFSPDGQHVVTAGAGGVIVITDVATGADVMAFNGDAEESPDSLCFSPDGTHVLLAYGRRALIEFRDVVSGSLSRTIPCDGAYAMSFSSDGTKILSEERHRSFTLRDAATGSRLRTFTDCTTMRISPDSRLIAGADARGMIRVWKIAEGSEEQVLRGHTQEVLAMHFCQDENVLVSCGVSGEIKHWDLTTSRQVRTLDLRFNFPAYVSALSQDGRYLAASIRYGQIELWDISDAKKLNAFQAHAGDVLSLAFSPDGKSLLSHDLSRDFRTFRLWHLEKTGLQTGSHRVVGESAPRRNRFLSLVTASPDARHMCVSRSPGKAEIWDLSSGALSSMIRLKGANRLAWGFSPDGRDLIVSGRDLTAKKTHVLVWNVQEKMQSALFDVSIHIPLIEALACSSDGSEIIVGGRLEQSGSPGRIVVVDRMTGQFIRMFQSERPLRQASATCRSVKISRNGAYAAIYQNNGFISVWDCRTGDRVCEEGPAFHGYGFSQNEKFLFTLNKPTVCVWDLETGDKVSEFDSGYPDDGFVYPLSGAFSPDGARLLLGFEGEHISIWDALKGERLFVLYVESFVHDVTCSEDGNKVVALCEDGLRVWESSQPLGVSLFDYWYHCALNHLDQDRWNEAISDFNRAIEVSSDYSIAWYTRGLAHNYDNKRDEAISDFGKAIQLAPHNSEYVGQRGLAYYHAGEYKEAIVDLDRAIQLDARNQSFWYRRGLAHLRSRAYDYAIADSSEAINLDMRFVNAYWLRGLAKEALKRHEEAIIDLSEAIGLDSTNPNLLRDRGKMYFNSAHYESAMLDWARAEELHAGRSRGNNAHHTKRWLAWGYAICPIENLRNGAEAVRLAMEACEMTGMQDVQCLATLAAAYAECEDFRAAVKWQREALDRLPENGSSRQSEDFNYRLKLYESHRPYRHELEGPSE